MNNPKLLSGRELVEHGAKKTTNSLPAKSPKDIIPNKSISEEEEIKKILGVRKELIADHRVEKRNTLSHGEWKKDLQKAIITDKKGSYWNYIGHSDESITYIYPEEALFLMEINSLLLSYEGVPVSIQQAYSLLLGKTILLHEYRAYSQLMREGYKLLRHDDTRKYSNDRLKDCSNVKITETISVESAGTLKDKTNSNSLKSSNESNDPIKVNQSIASFHKNEDDLSIMGTSKKLLANSKNKSEMNLQHSDDSVDMVDDNSDDCMVISENSLGNGKRKAIDIENKSKRSKVPDKNQENIDVIDLENEPDYNKFEILNKMVNCYGKKIAYVEAPENKFIPPNINLQKPYYFYEINKKNEKVSLSDNEVNHQLSSHTSNRSEDSVLDDASQIRRPNSTSSATLPNNAFYVNHVYQNISIQETSYGMKMESSSSYYYYGNAYLQNNALPASTKDIESSKNQSFTNLPKKSVFNPFSRSKSLRLDISKNPNPFSSTFNDSINKHLRKKRRNKNKISTPASNSKSIVPSGDSNFENENLDTYKKLKTIIKKCKRSIKQAKTQNLKMKITAQLTTALKKMKKLQKINKSIEVSNPLSVNPNIIVQVSSDSENSDNNPKLMQQNEVPLDDKISNRDIENTPNLPPLNDAKKKTVNRWFDPNLWQCSNSKSKCKEQLVKMNSSIFNIIRKVNLEKNNIKSWNHLKNYCNMLNVENTVSISDDEEDIDKRKITESIQFKKLEDEDIKTDNIKISYDIYKPNCKMFKKSDPPIPPYVLLIRSIDSPVLLPQDFDNVHSRIPHNVVILVAVVSSDSVFFMEMDKFELPQLTGSDLEESDDE